MTPELKDELFAQLIALMGRAENELDGINYMDFLKQSLKQIDDDLEFLIELSKKDRTVLAQ